MKKIVLVDDYADWLTVLKETIEHFNDAKCVKFSNPIEALNYVRKHKNVDIIITDYQMPQMDGFTLAKKILESYPNKRVIISSGHDKTTLGYLLKKHGLEGKAETICKDSLEFYKNLV